jgi:hypothetical protein
MAIEDPLGGMSWAEDNAARSLAACTQFQLDTNSADAAEALTHIYFDALTPPADRSTYSAEELTDLRPFCIVATHPTENGFSWGRIGAEAWDDSGTLILIFQYPVPAGMEEDNQALMRWFKNRLGNIIRPDTTVSGQSSYVGMSDLAHSGGYLAGSKVSLGILGRADQKVIKTEGDFVMATLLVQWGVQA